MYVWSEYMYVTYIAYDNSCHSSIHRGYKEVDINVEYHGTNPYHIVQISTAKSNQPAYKYQIGTCIAYTYLIGTSLIASA